MVGVSGSRQCVSQGLPDLWITWIFLHQLRQVRQEIIERPVAPDQVAVGMQGACKVATRQILAGSQQNAVSFNCGRCIRDWFG
jgi:hypothetical protein